MHKIKFYKNRKLFFKNMIKYIILNKNKMKIYHFKIKKS